MAVKLFPVCVHAFMSIEDSSRYLEPGFTLRVTLTLLTCSGSLFDVNESSDRSLVVEGKQIAGSHVDTAARGGAAQSGFVADAMDVDIPGEGIDTRARIQAVFQSAKPEYSVCNGCLGHALPSVADLFSAFEHRACGEAAADFPLDPMEAQRGFVGALPLSDAKTGGRYSMGSNWAVAVKTAFSATMDAPKARDDPERLAAHLHQDNPACRPHIGLAAGVQTSNEAGSGRIKPRRNEGGGRNAKSRQARWESGRNTGAGFHLSFLIKTFERRPLRSYFSRRAGGRSSGDPSEKPPFAWK